METQLLRPSAHGNTTTWKKPRAVKPSARQTTTTTLSCDSSTLQRSFLSTGRLLHGGLRRTRSGAARTWLTLCPGCVLTPLLEQLLRPLPKIKLPPGTELVPTRKHPVQPRLGKNILCSNGTTAERERERNHTRKEGRKE